jgi:hypothetical protein
MNLDQLMAVDNQDKKRQILKLSRPYSYWAKNNNIERIPIHFQRSFNILRKLFFIISILSLQPCISRVRFAEFDKILILKILRRRYKSLSLR